MALTALLLGQEDAQNSNPVRLVTVCKEWTSPPPAWNRTGCPHPHPIRSIGQCKGQAGLPARVSFELSSLFPSSLSGCSLVTPPAQRQTEREGMSHWWSEQVMVLNHSLEVNGPPLTNPRKVKRCLTLHDNAYITGLPSSHPTSISSSQSSQEV